MHSLCLFTCGGATRPDAVVAVGDDGSAGANFAVGGMVEIFSPLFHPSTVDGRRGLRSTRTGVSLSNPLPSLSVMPSPSSSC